jgi:hypothetical protein
MSDRSSATPAHTQDLQRAQLALQVLSRAGLGDLDWVGGVDLRPG